MTFELNKSLEILNRTPKVLRTQLEDLSKDWITQNEGGDTWSVYDIVGHLIHGEKTDWIPRLEIILSHTGTKTFEVFDRFAQFEASRGKSLSQLLAEFSQLRSKNIDRLVSLNLREDQLHLKGMHPALGEVTARQLLSTWVVHDLNHLSQMSRVMAHQYKSQVGPWFNYLGILK